jgi:hypothetical protein
VADTDLALGVEIAVVADEEDMQRGGPIRGRVDRLHGHEIIDQDRADRVAKVRTRDRAEALLPGRVPDL